jgi:hypothetical protein
MEAFLQYLTFPFLLEGMWLTLRIFAASMVGGGGGGGGGGGRRRGAGPRGAGGASRSACSSP